VRLPFEHRDLMSQSQSFHGQVRAEVGVRTMGKSEPYGEISNITITACSQIPAKSIVSILDGISATHNGIHRNGQLARFLFRCGA